MRTPEDPCRDPASEARDDWEQLCQPLTDEERRENARKIEALSVPDRFALMFSNASKPRATPEVDGAYLAILDNDSIHVCDELGAMASFSRRLERQRDELLEALVELRDWYLENTGLPAAKANAAIAAVKGGNG